MGWRVLIYKFQADSDKQLAPSSSGDAPPPMDHQDWRAQLTVDDHRRIVNKILESFKKHFPYSAPEGLQELERIALRLEENVYSAATSQSDYLRKISLEMLTLEAQSQSAMANSPKLEAVGSVNKIHQPTP